MALKIIAAILLLTWFALVLLGKGGFVHMLFLVGIVIVGILLTKEYRRRI
ncbi:MAG: hypothetical protein ACK5NT_08095 [Pyrinomonadaceae bacterium]